MTPNLTDVRVLAQAARDGGADGVTATNTVSGGTALRWHCVAKYFTGASPRFVYYTIRLSLDSSTTRFVYSAKNTRFVYSAKKPRFVY
ncbi:hypothetical protein niasHT_023806 [Heterodera trifolii]|uniref:Uncharacterized protein n=1 Tax=Heterodera trifolii TaxID=157864 RepID=A0ABD2JRT4_9BILA